MREKTACASCHWAQKSGQLLECRFNPPVATPVIGPNKLGQPSVICTVATFPIVQPEWWCSGHKDGEPRAEPPPKSAPASRPLILSGLRQ